MSPSRQPDPAADHCFEDLDLNIVGLGVQYPPFQHGPDALEVLADRFYPKSTALSKVLTINQCTGINTRSSIGETDHPLINRPDAPSIAELSDVFLKEGVALSVAASRKAVEEWGGRMEDITHVVATTCTHSANPGFDHFVVKELGIDISVEKVLLHGVGCSGGLAALRSAANLALGASFQRRPARVLVVACEITTLLVRSELDSVDKDQTVRIGATLFSDCASAAVLSNGVGDSFDPDPIYELLGWKHRIIPETEGDLGFDVDPLGWKVVLSHSVPKKASTSVESMFQDLIKTIPEIKEKNLRLPADFDWALHPGGSTVITGVQNAVNLTEDHLRASYETYINHGNSSSATIFSVMDQLRQMGRGRDYVVGCAFGPGIAIEMAVMKRGRAMESPPAEPLD
ncbi:MAG: hypothetical protein M1837_005945 [Sclerophora amabilis]|nr:MAG: hypothetical protein M1837_005945 [Sclerophora amabilis]